MRNRGIPGVYRALQSIAISIKSVKDIYGDLLHWILQQHLTNKIL